MKYEIQLFSENTTTIMAQNKFESKKMAKRGVCVHVLDENISLFL
jgi:hypothetical protein